jgi:hypothetical protein
MRLLIALRPFLHDLAGMSLLTVCRRTHSGEDTASFTKQIHTAQPHRNPFFRSGSRSVGNFGDSMRFLGCFAVFCGVFRQKHEKIAETRNLHFIILSPHLSTIVTNIYRIFTQSATFCP